MLCVHTALVPEQHKTIPSKKCRPELLVSLKSLNRLNEREWTLSRVKSSKNARLSNMKNKTVSSMLADSKRKVT